MVESADVDPLSRVIAWANDKGGVGKTSNATNCAGQFAYNGFKVLIVDVNSQGNAVIDLGCEQEDLNDQGSGLAKSLMFDETPQPQQIPGREGLHILPGGHHLENLPIHVSNTRIRAGAEADLVLRRILEPLAPNYDLVFIDTPPENLTMLDLALAASRWLMIPTRTDSASIKGMRRVAERFVQARQINTELRLMGAVLFATNRSAKKVHADAYAEIETAFGGTSPLFRAFVGYSEALARETRTHGKLAHELEAMAAEQPAWWEALRAGGTAATRVPATASNVSSDYSKVCVEMIDIITAVEQNTE